MRSSGWTSSVQKHHSPSRPSAISGRKVSRFRALEPSRTWTSIPAAALAAASSASVDSWSERIPAAAYATRSRPVTPGAWPSTTAPRSAAAWTLARTGASAPSTPGKFIISASPRTAGFSSSRATSSASSTAPAFSQGSAGTHDGAM